MTAPTTPQLVPGNRIVLVAAGREMRALVRKLMPDGSFTACPVEGEFVASYGSPRVFRPAGRERARRSTR